MNQFKTRSIVNDAMAINTTDTKALRIKKVLTIPKEEICGTVYKRAGEAAVNEEFTVKFNAVGASEEKLVWRFTVVMK